MDKKVRALSAQLDSARLHLHDTHATRKWQAAKREALQRASAREAGAGTLLAVCQRCWPRAAPDAGKRAQLQGRLTVHQVGAGVLDGFHERVLARRSHQLGSSLRGARRSHLKLRQLPLRRTRAPDGASTAAQRAARKRAGARQALLSATLTRRRLFLAAVGPLLLGRHGQITVTAHVNRLARAGE